MTELELATNSFQDFSFLATQRDLNLLLLTANHLTHFSVPPTLTKLETLYLDANSLNSLQIPPTLTRLENLNVAGNPLTNLAVLAGVTINPWSYQPSHPGLEITLYPILRAPRVTGGGVPTFDVVAGTGSRTILRSTDLQTWTEIGSLEFPQSNFLPLTFQDSSAASLPAAFYRVH